MSSREVARTVIAITQVLADRIIEAKRKQEDAGQGGNDPPPSKRHRRYNHPTEGEHRAAEQFQWRKSNVVSWLTFLAAFGAVFFAVKTWQQTKRQADIAQKNLVDTTRAWLDVDVDTSTASFTWNNGEPSIDVSVTATNDGPSPAIATTIWIRMVTRDTKPIDVTTVVSDNCLPTPEFFGRPLFPKEVLHQRTSTVLPKADIAKYIAWSASINKIPVSTVNWIAPYLIVCVNYHLSGDRTSHYTGRLFDPSKARVTSAGTLIPIGLTTGEDVPAGSLYLDEDLEGDSAN